MSSSYLVRRGDGPSLTALGSTYRTLADGAATAGAYTLLEEEFFSDSTPLHRHVEAEEAFYVLDGELEAWVEGSTTTATPGDFLLVPRGAAHGLRRLSAEPVRLLTLCSPPGFERVFEAVVDAGEEEVLADPDRLVALAARHGTEVLGDYPQC